MQAHRQLVKMILVVRYPRDFGSPGQNVINSIT